MGIFQKLSTLIKSNINDLIARAENPEKMLNQIIVDMREQLATAKREVAAAIADERKLREKYLEEAELAGDWEQRAMLAVREDRDDLARQALVRQKEHGERAASLERTWKAQAEETEKLKASLRRLNDKIEEARRKRNLLIAKQKRAQAQKRIHETMSGLSDTSAFEAFERMAEQIEQSERRSLAAAEVEESLTGDTLERQFDRLEAGSDEGEIEGRLQALKREMGLIAEGEAGERPRLGTGGEETDVEEVEAAEPEEEDVTEDEGERVRDADLIREFERLGRASGEES